MIAYYSDAPDNYIVSPEFQIYIMDPCDSPHITQPTLANQEYTITYASGTYPLDPLFSVSPSHCQTRIEAVVPASLQTYVLFDPEAQAFTYQEIKDTLELSGDWQTTYTIELFYSVLNENGQVTSVTNLSYDLTIKNPCVSEDNLNFITEVEMPFQYEYTLFDADLEIDSISLLQIEPEVCMQGLKYSVSFNEEEVTETSAPMKLIQKDHSAIRTSFYTEDRMYLNVAQTMIVRAELRFGEHIVMTSENRRVLQAVEPSLDTSIELDEEVLAPTEEIQED